MISLFVIFPCFLLRAFLHGGGGPQIGEATCGASPHLSCKRDQIKKRDFMDRRVTPHKRTTSPTWATSSPGLFPVATWAPPPSYEQALNRS